MAKIFINPGHDLYKDPGAVNVETGLTEAFVVAEIGKIVKKLLTAKEHDVYLLQNDHLSGVINEANEGGADIFVSIHCNGFTSQQANGTETLYYPGSKQGRRLAACLQRCMLEAHGLADRGIKECANLAVLRQTNMTAALAETAFITNPDNEKTLASEQGRQTWAKAIAQGIIDFEKRKGGHLHE